MSEGLRVLVVEDEVSACQELACFLRAMPEVSEVTAVEDGAGVVKLLGTTGFDAAFVDILMPGLDGMEVARVLGALSAPPAIVFVTASEDHAIEAFGIGAVDYLLKPVRKERLAEAVGRITRQYRGRDVPTASDELDVVRVEFAGRTVFVRRDDVQFVEAHGDYVRLHTASDTHLVRLSLSHLEDTWAHAGFLRVHRGYLVAVPWVRDLHVTSSSGLVASTPAGEVPVSRRHSRTLKQQLMEAARNDQLGRATR